MFDVFAIHPGDILLFTFEFLLSGTKPYTTTLNQVKFNIRGRNMNCDV